MSHYKLFDFNKDLNKATYSGYLLAFYLCSLFEFELRLLLNICISAINISLKTKQFEYKPKISDNWGPRDLFNRLLTYFPKSNNREFYQVVDQAIKDRNDFVHNAFIKISPNSISLKTGKSTFINNESIKKMFKWNDSHKKASNEIFNLIKRFGSKKLINRINKSVKRSNE